MMVRKIAGLSTAVLFVSISAVAQAGQPATTSQQAGAKGSDTGSTMTVVGCLVKEADYRRAHDRGKGALGGAGLGDEFVLVDATNGPASAASGSSPESAPGTTAAAPSTSANCSEQGVGTAYRLTGKREAELKSLVGHRLEITGRFDHARDARTAAGETHAKLPPEIAIASYREAPAAAAAPPAAAAPTGTSGAAPRTETTPPATTAPANPLPKTASDQPLIALIALLCLGAGVGLHTLRRRVS
jgi:hypothetical protein